MQPTRTEPYRTEPCRTMQWKSAISRLCTFALVLMQWVSVGSTHEASRWMCISSRDQWNLTPATMCRGSAARALYEAETLEQQTMHLHKCDHVFFYLGKKSVGGGGGGVVRLIAKPRYLLLLHRGEKKSNTVTALIYIYILYKASNPLLLPGATA